MIKKNIEYFEVQQSLYFIFFSFNENKTKLIEEKISRKSIEAFQLEWHSTIQPMPTFSTTPNRVTFINEKKKRHKRSKNGVETTTKKRKGNGKQNKTRVGQSCCQKITSEKALLKFDQAKLSGRKPSPKVKSFSPVSRFYHEK